MFCEFLGGYINIIIVIIRYRYNWIRKTCHRFECANDGKKWMSIGRFYMVQTGRPLRLVVRSWISHGPSDRSLTVSSRCFSEDRKQDSRRWAPIFIDDIKRSSMSLVKACELGLSHQDHKCDAWLIRICLIRGVNAPGSTRSSGAERRRFVRQVYWLEAGDVCYVT